MSRFERWSQRKRGLDTDDASERQAPIIPSGMTEASDAPFLEEQADDAPLEVQLNGEEVIEGNLDEQLPDPDTLGPGSDFKAFMATGVSAGLRRRALRRLFSNGKYNIRDGLDDYDHDYSQMKSLAEGASETIRQWAKRAVDATEEDNEAAQQTKDPQEDATGRAHTSSEPDEAASPIEPIPGGVRKV